MGFPALPGLPAHAPTGLINPGLDYDFGPDFNYDGRLRRRDRGAARASSTSIKLKVPRVDADGNELGGVPVVLRDAPLGTYLGWNITAAGFHKGQNCNYAGGMIPFAKTKAERLANEDPRPSLEERYGNHAGYVAAVDSRRPQGGGGGLPAASRREDAGRRRGSERRAEIGRQPSGSVPATPSVGSRALQSDTATALSNGGPRRGRED